MALTRTHFRDVKIGDKIDASYNGTLQSAWKSVTEIKNHGSKGCYGMDITYIELITDNNISIAGNSDYGIEVLR